MSRELTSPDWALYDKKVKAAPHNKVSPIAIYEQGPDGRVVRITRPGMPKWRLVRNYFGDLLYNTLITRVPSHTIRLGYLRLLGANIGKGSSVLRGTQMDSIEFLTIGNDTSIGSRCVLDARGGLWIGDNVVIASHVQVVSGGHDVQHPDFLPIMPNPTVIEDYVWIASRAMTVGCLLRRGAVVGAQSLVVGEVGELDIVCGIPAKVIGKRDTDALGYSGKYRPLFC